MAWKEVLIKTHQSYTKAKREQIQERGHVECRRAILISFPYRILFVCHMPIPILHLHQGILWPSHSLQSRAPGCQRTMNNRPLLFLNDASQPQNGFHHGIYVYPVSAHIHVQVCVPFNIHPYFSWFAWLSYFVTCIWMPGQNLGTPGLVLHLPERHQGLCTAWQGLPWFGEVHYVFTVLTPAMWKSHLCLLNQLHLKSISMAQVRCWPSSGCDSLHGWPGPSKTKVTSGCWGVNHPNAKLRS